VVLNLERSYNRTLIPYILSSPLPLSPSLTHHPCCRSHCFHRHRPCHRPLIAVSKRWAMVTAAAMACRCSNCFYHHRPCHCRLIVMSKRWTMATAAAMAALRAMALGGCSGSSSNNDGCRDSRGMDDGNGSNGVGDDSPCHPYHGPLRHPQCCYHHHCSCCCQCHCICCHPHHCSLCPPPAAIAIALSFRLHRPLCHRRQHPL
jgi:hypothetical protein